MAELQSSAPYSLYPITEAFPQYKWVTTPFYFWFLFSFAQGSKTSVSLFVGNWTHCIQVFDPFMTLNRNWRMYSINEKLIWSVAIKCKAVDAIYVQKVMSSISRAAIWVFFPNIYCFIFMRRCWSTLLFITICLDVTFNLELCVHLGRIWWIVLKVFNFFKLFGSFMKTLNRKQLLIVL